MASATPATPEFSPDFSKDGVTKALQWYIELVPSAAKQTKDVFNRAFKEIKDDGSKTFGSLWNEIESDSRRIAAQQGSKALAGYALDLLSNKPSAEENKSSSWKNLKWKDFNWKDKWKESKDEARQALSDYVDSIPPAATQLDEYFSKSFQNAGAALKTFAETGKLDFKGLVDSMKSNLEKLLAEQALKSLANVFLSFLGGPPGIPGVSSGDYSLLQMGYPSAKGNAFGFANGGAFTNGLYSSPTPFMFANGGGFNLGVMGEAGPEAVMPLARDGSGRLGVRSQGGGVNVSYAPVINVDSRTDRAEVERLVSGAVKQGNAELVDKLSRQGVL